MSFFDFFKIKEFKLTIEQQKEKIAELEKLMTPELKEISKSQDLLKSIQNEINETNINFENKKNAYEKEISSLNSQIITLNNEIEKKKQDIIVFDEQILLQEFALYTPIYNFATSQEYKNKLEMVRNSQKEMVKKDTAVSYNPNFMFNNSASKGKKIVKDNVKQILRSFNNECETLIDKAKFNNIDSIKSRITKSYEALNKLNSMLDITINPKYLDLKLQELNLAYEYSLKKHQEKEAEKERRAELREIAKLEKELAEERKKITKEQIHYQQALIKIISKLDTSSEEEKKELLQKKFEIEAHLEEIDNNIKNLDYRENNQKAGYVYIISNVGSFGENIYKIGMTRRLEPMDRVDELGDASVPFKFDVHAMIFSDNAPALENALHKAFEHKKLNMVNSRREFFNVTLEEIEQVVKANFDKTVEFVKEPIAKEYRESLKMKA